LEVFRRLIVEKVEPDDRVMERMAVRRIDAKDLRAAGSFLEIGNVVFGKLLAQVDANHIEFGYVTHVPCVHPSGSCIPGPGGLVRVLMLAIGYGRPSIRAQPVGSHEGGQYAMSVISSYTR